ncbi:hypothetical protein VAE151_530102 [Vibrio aestuarianus]|uniref:Uncharacterized protein n=2 Tax=Vibrio aestuarianus TaxID=28171 RepID=A0ABM9FNW2_9VIBR|nr:hypothetical protein VAE308_1030009 [Vibrio aestuarianus]CAH8190092.1 hypothetical protein VIBAE_A30574 [Vibrio aestuarianus subsp. francensis]CAH8190065.1 hypothetical protein VAE032_250105 [Vibrio aestuarianus]CAH8190161.1 hypothetical protein VAE055_350105 [Vibrio aestuarianus]CAH8190311.1 hypothetical protein VAE128_440577 [Vibrio aestuarianus]
MMNFGVIHLKLMIFNLLLNKYKFRNLSNVLIVGRNQTNANQLAPSLFENVTLYCDYLPQSKTIGEFQHAPDREIYQLSDKLQLKERNKNDITIFDSSGIAYLTPNESERLYWENSKSVANIS